MGMPAPEPHDPHAAFSALALTAMDDVYRFAKSLTHDESDAEDVVQETYLRAFRSWHTFQEGTDVRRWLFTIARNVFLRSKERERRTIALEDPEGESAAAVAQHVEWRRDGTDELLLRVGVGPAITDALAAVPEPFRSAVILVDLEDLSYDAASEVLGVPVGTVRSRLFRGRRVLQTLLLEHARDAGFTTTAGSESR